MVEIKEYQEEYAKEMSNIIITNKRSWKRDY